MSVLGGRSPDSGRMRKTPSCIQEEKSPHHHFPSQVQDSSLSSRSPPSSTRFHRNVVSWLQHHRSSRDIVTSVTRPTPAKLPRIHGRSVVSRGFDLWNDLRQRDFDFRPILSPGVPPLPFHPILAVPLDLPPLFPTALFHPRNACRRCAPLLSAPCCRRSTVIMATVEQPPVQRIPRSRSARLADQGM